MEGKAALSKNKELSAIVKKKSLIAESLLLLIQPLDFISNKILRVHNITMTADFSILARGRSPFHLSALEAAFSACVFS